MTLKAHIRRVHGYTLLRSVMHGTDIRRAYAQDITTELYLSLGRGLKILDLGCGVGASFVWFRKLDPDVEWYGVDIEDSPEVRARSRSRPDKVFSSFDGINLPYDDAFFDIVYCTQVFEHVKQPHELMHNIQRVLKPGGRFVGSVAYLEPYHSFSVFNFTPFGMIYLMELAGLKPEGLWFCNDCFHTIFRQLTNKARFMNWLGHVSLLYSAFEIFGRLGGLDRKDINLFKILFSGAFCFDASKPP